MAISGLIYSVCLNTHLLRIPLIPLLWLEESLHFFSGLAAKQGKLQHHQLFWRGRGGNFVEFSVSSFSLCLIGVFRLQAIAGYSLHWYSLKLPYFSGGPLCKKQNISVFSAPHLSVANFCVMIFLLGHFITITV